MDDDSEVVVGDSGSDDSDLCARAPPPPPPAPPPEFEAALKRLPELIPGCDAELRGAELTLRVPRDPLPLALQAACGFRAHRVAVEVRAELSAFSWTARPERVRARHPLLGANFAGRALAEDAVRRFFAPGYAGAGLSRAAACVFGARADSAAVSSLTANGFRRDRAAAALRRCGNDTGAAAAVLSGCAAAGGWCAVRYSDCPPAYLVLEVVAALLDLSDHCCVCRRRLEFAGIRPAVCANRLCEVAFNEIGAGASVLQEIRRDALAADWVLTIYGCALRDGRYVFPAPPAGVAGASERVLRTLPAMARIAEACASDADIARMFGADTLDALRWVLLTNKAQIISLPDELRVRGVECGFQFMTLIAAPDMETEFLRRKEEYGSQYLWHGSAVSRWYSIVQNGLKNMSRVRGGIVHGNAYGEGIYLSSNSTISLQYTDYNENPYVNSVLGKRLKMIACCEVAKMPKGVLNRFNNGIMTLIDEKACVVRFVFVMPDKEMFQLSSLKFSNRSLPDLEKVLGYLEKKAKQSQ